MSSPQSPPTTLILSGREAEASHLSRHSCHTRKPAGSRLPLNQGARKIPLLRNQSVTLWSHSATKLTRKLVRRASSLILPFGIGKPKGDTCLASNATGRHITHRVQRVTETGFVRLCWKIMAGLFTAYGAQIGFSDSPTN